MSNCSTSSKPCCQQTQLQTEKSVRSVTRPRTDIHETESAYVIQADMPGVDESSAQVSFEKNVLTISGEPQFNAPEGFESVYHESSARYFERSFRLNEQVNPQELKATVSRGVLTVVIPKAEELRRVQIPIQAG
ncbi:MAG: Hsp20/alpha crystallin family protein [Planctomycetaceae bacterium]|nr:Hsp20/alpha crystallin family protein [Planctomycetaceae bacterium]